MSSIRLQEILTRAVVGRCDRRVVWTHTAPANGADCVLGVHVSNSQLTVEDGADGQQVRLSAVCEVWCSAGDATRVVRTVCTHTESANVPLVARVVGEAETTGSLLRGARCLEAEVREGLFHLTLEMHIALEAMGVARLWVKTFDLQEDGAELDAYGSETSGSSQSAEETNAGAEWEPEPEFEAWAGLEDAAEPGAGAATGQDTDPVTDWDAAFEPNFEPDAEFQAAKAPRAEREAGPYQRTDIAAVASVPDRDAHRSSTAVTRFRGPTRPRISIVQ